MAKVKPFNEMSSIKIMKKTTLISVAGCIAIVVIAVFLMSSDQADSPSVTGQTTDIADLYAFEGDNPDNTVLIATFQSPLTPGGVTLAAAFDENVLIEFNIDNTGDFVEDLVIQAIKKGDSMYFFGPIAPTTTGLTSQVETSGPKSVVKISNTTDYITAENNNMKFFAGPRRDPFFFDFNRFNMVASGAAAGEDPPAGFLPAETASDFFANLNVLAVVVEVPNAMLGNAPTHIGGALGINNLPNSYNVWVSTKKKQ